MKTQAQAIAQNWHRIPDDQRREILAELESIIPSKNAEIEELEDSLRASEKSNDDLESTIEELRARVRAWESAFEALPAELDDSTDTEAVAAFMGELEPVLRRMDSLYVEVIP